MPDLLIQALGFVLLALVVVLWLRWEWQASAADRQRRREHLDQIQQFRRVK